MHNWFNNLKIRKKLLLAFMLMIALSLITSIIALSSYQRIGMNMVDLIDGEGKISDLSLKIQTAMLLARRYEKDYLLRYKQVGFKAAREKYLTKIHIQITQIYTLADAIILRETHQQDIDQLILLKKAIGKYESTFLIVVKLLEKRGFKDTGVEGKLRKSVHTIEASLKTHTFDQLMINMLMMRRHEKDYMLRHDKKYIAQLHEVATQFKQHLAETVLNVSEKQRLATRLKYYQAKVNEFVQIEQDIAKSISVFRTAVHTLEPLLVEIYSEAEDHKNDAQHQIQQVVFMMKGVIILAALIIFVFGLWIALFLANSLSKPLILTVHASKLLTEGNTALTGIDREALQQLATRPDEMGELGRAFEDLASYFQTVITDLVKVSQGLAMGNLDVRPTAEYKGDFIDIKYSLEMALSNESKVVDDIVLMSDGLSSGKRVTAEAEYKGRFVQVKDGLEMASIKLENATKQQVQQDWHKTGEGKLSALMNGEQDMETLGKTIISFLTSYVDAQMGLFYLHKKDDEESYLEIIASYAYTEHENLFKKYAFGKGLVGEVALERKMQSRIYTEEDQSRITQSGLSVVVPHQIIIIPFIYEGELKGLIEIGTSTNLTTLQETFLQEVMENIGIAVNAAESRARILVILEKTKVQALALDKQQREMDQKEQEMRFFQKKLRARKLKLAEQQKEIDRQNEERSLEIH